GARPPGAHGGELRAGVGDGLAHLVGGLGEHHVGHLAAHVVSPSAPAPTLPPPAWAGTRHSTRVPTSPPVRIARMFPSPIRSNITTGRSLSMHRVMAVESIARRPRLSTSR